MNSIYLEKVRDPKFENGDLRTIGKDYLIDSIEILQIIANQLVGGAITKVEKKNN